MNKFTTFSITVLFSLITIVILGFTTQYLWLWLVVPIFSVPALNFFQAWGLVFVIRYLTNPLSFSDFVLADSIKVEENTKLWAKYGLKSFIYTPLSALLVGYILHLFM